VEWELDTKILNHVLHFSKTNGWKIADAIFLHSSSNYSVDEKQAHSNAISRSQA
jgi:hypothetical protein